MLHSMWSRRDIWGVQFSFSAQCLVTSLIQRSSLKCLILKLSWCCQRLVDFDATRVRWLELQMISFSNISCLKIRRVILQWWLTWPCISFQFLKPHLWDGVCYVEQKGHLRSLICLLSCLMLWKLLLFSVFVVGKFGLIGNAIWHLAEFDTTCKHIWCFKYAYFFKISGLDFDFFLGVVVTLCGTNKHFSGGPNHELQEQ
jgi:hypothetical protein